MLHPSKTIWKGLHLAYAEAMLFKFGPGTGTDLTPIRSAREKLSGGGRPSGPMSFLGVCDQVANVVKSGGKTRRAAKMNTLRDCTGTSKSSLMLQKEEKKAWALIEQGYDGSWRRRCLRQWMYQNENLSVRAGDEFMTAVTGEQGRVRSPAENRSKRRTPRNCYTRLPKAPGSAATPACNTTARLKNGTPARARADSLTNPCSE
ncbi:MAG: hypothetical protein U1F83_06590 [Verrucomicrobiota bacterium]